MRRRQRRLRSWLRRERVTVAMLLATYEHHTAPRGQWVARSGGWVRDEVHDQAPAESTPQAAGVQHFFLDDDEPPAAGSRPDRIATLSGLEERDLRRTVQQIVDAVLRCLFSTILCRRWWNSCQMSCASSTSFCLFRAGYRKAFLSGLWSRTSNSLLVEAFKIFSQDRAHLHLLHLQLVFVVLQMGLEKGFSHFSQN